jgi:membrane-associated HD superfamily phosphohydrolase
MDIEINAIYNFLLALFFTTVAFTLGIFIKSKVANKPPITDEEDQVQKIDADMRYERIVRQAQEHAKTLARETAAAASEILSGTKKTNEHLEENLDRVLSQIAAANIHSMKEATQNFDKDYRQILQSIEGEIRQTTSRMVEEAKKQYEAQLDTFLKELLKNATATQAQVDKKTAELLSIAEADIAEYKKQKMARADEEVRNLVQKAYRDVLRTSIPENLHEELIMKSLEEAKKDGLFKT